jgi:hypothetical protein
VVRDRLHVAGIKAGICVAYYDWPDDVGDVVVHLGFDITDQSLADDEDVRVVEVPSVEVASAIHRGALNDITDTFEAVVRWIEDNGLQDRRLWPRALPSGRPRKPRPKRHRTSAPHRTMMPTASSRTAP